MSKTFGLIGYPLSHSFSKKYFSEKFQAENISDCRYELFPLAQIEDVSALFQMYPDLAGLNVTIPYKERVIPYLDELDDEAAAVGAVNTIKIQHGKLIGYNTDVVGFRNSLLTFLPKETIPTTLILGTGGAAKAVGYVIEQLGFPFQYVSRQPKKGESSYEDLLKTGLKNYSLIVNTTPLGMFPNLDSCPLLSYEQLNVQHFLFDLVYNPAETLFLKKGRSQGSHIMNGLEMLIGQAEKAWEIWTGSSKLQKFN